MVSGATRLVAAGAPHDAVPALTLALEAARSRWGAGQGTPWWWAADAYVEAGRLALIEAADGLLFRRACAVADEQISVLRDSDRAEDIAELAETLFAAGLLRVSPYVGQMSGLSFESANDLWRERRARHRSIHLDGSLAAESAEMPLPLAAAEEALRYLREAADLSREHNRGRVLKALTEDPAAPHRGPGLPQHRHHPPTDGRGSSRGRGGVAESPDLGGLVQRLSPPQSHVCLPPTGERRPLRRRSRRRSPGVP